MVRRRGDTVPVLARWSELTPNVELRIVGRDETPR